MTSEKIKTRPPQNLKEFYPALNDGIQSSNFALELIYEANSFINNYTLFENVDIVITSDRQARHLFANSIRELENLGITHVNLNTFLTIFHLLKYNQKNKLVNLVYQTVK